jgi:hypothetical protein
MCTALFTQKPQTIVRDPKEAPLPVPPAQPDPRHLGDGAATRAAIQIKRRKDRIDAAVDEATK